MFEIKTIISKTLNHPHYKNFRGFIIGGVIAFLIGYFSNFIINKNLDKENLGLFSYYYGLMTLFAHVATLNVYNAYLRFNNKLYDTNKLKKIVSTTSIMSTIILFIASYLVFNNLLISSFSFFILFNERIYKLRSEKHIFKMNLLKYISNLLLILCLVYYLSQNSLSYEKILFSYGVCYIIVYLIGIIIDRKSNTDIEKPINSINKKTILKYTFPGTITVIITWVATFSDQLIIKQYLSLTELGNYAIAVRILTLIKVFTSLFLLYYPMLYFEEAAKGNLRLIMIIRYFFITALFLLTVFLIAGRNYIYFFMGANEYLSYTYIFVLLAIAEFLKIVSTIFLTFRAYTLQTWYNTAAIGIVAFSTLFLNYLIIPKYGIGSAALIRLLAGAMMLFVSYLVAIRPEAQYFKHTSHVN